MVHAQTLGTIFTFMMYLREFLLIFGNTQNTELAHNITVEKTFSYETI